LCLLASPSGKGSTHTNLLVGLTPRGENTDIVQLPPDADTIDIDLSTWVPTSFISESYKSWCQEWRGKLFAASAHTYRHVIDTKHVIPDDAVSFLPTLSPFFNFNFIGN